MSGGTSAVAYTSVSCVVLIVVLRHMKPCRWLSARARCICVLKHLDRRPAPRASVNQAKIGLSRCSNLKPRGIIFLLLELRALGAKRVPDVVHSKCLFWGKFRHAIASSH